MVNVNPFYTPREMQHQLSDSEAEVIVVLANFSHKLEKILSKTSIKHVIVTETGDQLDGLKKVIVNGVVKHIKKMGPKYQLPNTISFNRALAIGSNKSFKEATIKGEDIAFL